MIAARKHRAIAHMLVWDARRRIRRSFSTFRVRGLAALRSELSGAPVLVVSNHTAWWDALVSVVLADLSGADAYAMMDAANLRRLPFFAAVGAFGVDLNDPADGARAVRYAAGRLDRPGRLVWMFPQGREVPVTTMPLAFRGGSVRIARKAPSAQLIPAALRYEQGGLPEPVLWVSFGSPLPRDALRSLAAQESAVAGELNRIERAIEGQDGEFDVVLRKRRSAMDELAERGLALLTRRLIR